MMLLNWKSESGQAYQYDTRVHFPFSIEIGKQVAVDTVSNERERRLSSRKPPLRKDTARTFALL